MRVSPRDFVRPRSTDPLTLRHPVRISFETLSTVPQTWIPITTSSGTSYRQTTKDCLVVTGVCSPTFLPDTSSVSSPRSDNDGHRRRTSDGLHDTSGRDVVGGGIRWFSNRYSIFTLPLSGCRRWGREWWRPINSCNWRNPERSIIFNPDDTTL